MPAEPGQLRGRLGMGWLRLRTSALPIAQCGVSAGASWFVAADLLGHARPFFAPIAAVISLGVALGSRLRRVVELVLGVSLGVLIGDTLISFIGSGPWQIVVVVVLAMSVAVLADGGALFVGQAASSAVLVATLLPPSTVGLLSGIDRCVDALVGGGLGLVVAALLPTDPVAPVRKQARSLFDELADVLFAAAAALRNRDRDAAPATLAAAGGTQARVDALRAALRAGREVVTVAPLRRRRRRTINKYAMIAESADYAMRNARVLVRRVYGSLRDDEPAVPALPDAVTRVANSIGAVTEQLSRDGDLTRARSRVLDAFADVAALSDPAVGLGASQQVIVAQLRSIVLDLLQATGLRREEALAAMRERAAS